MLGSLPIPQPLTPRELAARAQNAWVLDTRMELAFGAAHVPGAVSIWEEGVPSFAGWFLDYRRPILLVTKSNEVSSTVRYLVRMGFDRIEGYLAGGMGAWHKAGLASESISTVTVQKLCGVLDGGPAISILDVRDDQEANRDGEIPGALRIHLTQLPARKEEVPKDKPVYVFCGSGLRSMVAASILKREGWQNLTVVLGGLAGWNSVNCPIKK